MIITRRYVTRGPSPEDLKLLTDPGLVLASPWFTITYDVQFDDAISTVAAMDDAMSRWGCVPETVDTSLSAEPFLGIHSPDGSIWKLMVSNLGIFSVMKVSP